MAKTKVNDEMRTVYIPKESRNDESRYISVNGERILVKTGQTVEIPERFAEVIENSERMSVISQKFIESNIQK